MQNVAGLVKKRLEKISDNLSKSAEYGSLTKEERRAIKEAESLADRYVDVVPDVTTISANHLFRLADSK